MKLFRSARVVAVVALVLMGTGCIFTARVDVNTNEAPADEDLPPAASPLSADGRYVAFVSNASNLGVTNLPASGGLVYRRDQQTGTTTPVSVPFSGNAALTAEASRPAISGNGRYVSFVSGASNLVPSDSNNRADVFRRDVQSGTTLRVSVDGSGNQIAAGIRIYKQAISSDGRYLTFVTAAGLAAGDTDTSPSVYRKDMVTGAVALVSFGLLSTAGEASAMSSDGNIIAFETRSALIPGDTDSNSDIYVRNMSAGTIQRASVSTSGVQADNHSFDAAVSPDGTRVVFFSNASNLVSGDTNNAADVFVRRLDNSTTTRVNVSSSGVQGNGATYVDVLTRCPAGISSNGRYVVFSTTATNFTATDVNGSQRSSFVRDTVSGTTALVDTDQNGEQHSTGSSECPQISPDGRYISFVTSTPQILPDNTTGWEIVVRANPVPTFVSRTPASVARGTTATVTVNGTNFVTGTSPVTAYFGAGITITNTVRTETQVKFTISVAADAAPGARTVVVYNPGTGGGTLTGASTRFGLTIT